MGNKINKKTDVFLKKLQGKKVGIFVDDAMDVVRNIDKVDAIIIMSGDSDFVALKEYVMRDKNKMILFVGYEENMAWELRQC